MTSFPALSRRKLLAALSVAPVLSFGTAGAASPPSPTARSARLVVGFSAGAGTNDIMARLIAQKLTERMNQTFVVDNRPGASGNIGADLVAKAPPDGDTLLMMSLPFTANPSLYPKLPFNPQTDLSPVTLVAEIPLVLVVHPSVPANSVAELLKLARSQPGQLNYGSGGAGSAPHLAAELLKSMTKTYMTHIPYKGGAPALTDLVGGQVQLMLESVPGTLPLIKSGKLRALAVSGKARSPLLPGVPTLDEAGVKGYEIVGWNGIMVPAGTPQPTINRLNAEIASVLKSPDVVERLASMGAMGRSSSPAEFGVFIKSETTKWARLVKSAGIVLE